VYSLGCVLFQAVSGRAPFDAQTPAEMMMQHASKPAEPPSRWNAAVSPSLDTVILRMIAKQAAERYASGAEVAVALEAFE
jgi:serine/threonine-protein kinase